MTLKRLLASLLLAGSLMSAGAAEAQSLEKYRGLPWYKQPGPAARRLGLAPTADPYKGMKKVLFIADQSTAANRFTILPIGRWQSWKRSPARMA